MEEIRNADGKLVCRVDPTSQMVEIVRQGVRTLIRFAPNGALIITNNKT